MRQTPLFSIITVNLNNLEGLKDTVKSVQGQTYRDFEHIIIDGDSNDGSRQYLIELAKEGLTWISEPDKGIYEGMNKGIKKAQGDYYCFLNSGDCFASDTILEKVRTELNSVDLLYGNMVKVFPDGSQKLDKGPEGSRITLNTFITGTINHSSSFIRKSLFIKYGLYDENLRIVSDWKFFLTALGLNNSVIKYLDLDISRFDMTGISNTNLGLRNSERKMVINEIIPKPILYDYLSWNQSKDDINKQRNSKLDKIQRRKIPRKIHSFVLSLLSKFS